MEGRDSSLILKLEVPAKRVDFDETEAGIECILINTIGGIMSRSTGSTAGLGFDLIYLIYSHIS